MTTRIGISAAYDRNPRACFRGPRSLLPCDLSPSHPSIGIINDPLQSTNDEWVSWQPLRAASVGCYHENVRFCAIAETPFSVDRKRCWLSSGGPIFAPWKIVTCQHPTRQIRLLTPGNPRPPPLFDIKYIMFSANLYIRWTSHTMISDSLGRFPATHRRDASVGQTTNTDGTREYRLKWMRRLTP